MDYLALRSYQVMEFFPHEVWQGSTMIIRIRSSHGSLVDLGLEGLP